MKPHPIQTIISDRLEGTPVGIYSICSANSLVIQAALEKGMESKRPVLIEATANQVNQSGGYTGMKPSDFSRYVMNLAEELNFPMKDLILGGDHLGPIIWKDQPGNVAMENAGVLIRDYVMAGFSKIHIDTSMRLGDDDPDMPLDTGLVAERGAILCKAAEKAWEEFRKHSADSYPPVYVIGSEVPVPGGTEGEEGLKVTSRKDFLDTMHTYEKKFSQFGLQDAWKRVVGVVVQPGVEFSDEKVHAYNREKALELVRSISDYPGVVFEGHSTDYQSPAHLREMVEDGIAILKVGPALTFAMREALFMMSHIEAEVVKLHSGMQFSNFTDILDNEMVKNPKNWEKYYHGKREKVEFCRKYSLSDRIRYYLPLPEVKRAMEVMIRNLMEYPIPMTLLSQYLPNQYRKVRDGKLGNQPELWIVDKIKELLDDYEYAVSGTSSV